MLVLQFLIEAGKVLIEEIFLKKFFSKGSALKYLIKMVKNGKKQAIKPSHAISDFISSNDCYHFIQVHGLAI